uniref:Mitochondrial import inner membrane translocase subunit TIM50 n=2 Tax=Oryza brachyantha TaxID=4533 RepID=J3M4U9_ORYBR
YASLVLDHLDPAGVLFSHRLYRGACRDPGDGRLVKDLAATGRELHRAVIVDDNPNAYSLQPENAVPVAPFIDDANDQELERVMGILAIAAEFDDTRDAIKHYKDLVEAT